MSEIDMQKQVDDIYESLHEDYLQAQETDNEEEREQREFLSVDLERVAKIWITFGGPNIWIELDEHGRGVIHGVWGSDSGKRYLSQARAEEVLSLLGFSTSEELFEYLDERGSIVHEY